MKLEEQVVVLEGRLRDLITEWERFFSGARKVPPHAERDRLAQRLRQLSEQQTHRAAERFRLKQLQHRFMTYAINWERMLRENEEGRGRAPVARSGGSRPLDADVVRVASVDRREGEDLYDRYLAAKRRAGQEVRVDRAAFEARMAEQRRQLEARLGRRVRFEVVEDGDKVKLAARKTAVQEE